MDISINSAVGLDHYDRPIPEKRAPLLFVLRAPQILKPALVTAQLDRYVSWKPDPEAEAEDAFTLNWRGLQAYLFPPFCLIGRCLSKLEKDGATAVNVTPVSYRNLTPWKSDPGVTFRYGKVTPGSLFHYGNLTPLVEI